MFIFSFVRISSMTKAVRRTILALIRAVALVSAIKNDDNCGSGKSAKRVYYPFGFSSDSPIQLNCGHGQEIKLQDFEVQNITPDSIVVNLPAQCHREIPAIEPLFSKNYALLARSNSLIFHNCSSQSSDCRIPMTLFEGRINSQNCTGNISCLSPEPQSEFLTFSDVNGSGCRYLLLSAADDSGNDSAVSLELETAELGWWMHPPCNCSGNAKPTHFSVPGGGLGCRCRCNEGFEGNGFKDGNGCRKGTPLQSSYEGNPTLCGPSLLNKCPEDTAKQESPAHSSEDDTQENMGLYISIALGFIVGFWTVCGTLILNSSWRYAYFHFLNEMKDWCLVTKHTAGNLLN